MNESKHTPGPWMWNGKDMPFADIEDAHGDVIAGVNECDRDDDVQARAEERANARLIASAPVMAAEIARLRAVNAELTADYDSDFAAMREDRNMFRAQTADLLSILKAVRPWLTKAVDAGVFSECVRPSGGAIIQSRIEAAIKEAEAAQ